MSHIRHADCQHLIADVAMCKVGGAYLVECYGCANVLGVVAVPREFQALRRGCLKLEASVSLAAPLPPDISAPSNGENHP